MDILRREIAPLTQAGWNVIDDTAKETLKPLLTARRVVDFNGPNGWDYGALNLGELEIKESKSDVPWGVRKVLPLTEVRIPFVLNQHDVDSMTRGNIAPDVSSLEDASKKIALFEEKAVFNGFSEGCIKGILEETSASGLKLPRKDLQKAPEVVGEALKKLRSSSVDGPYTLILGRDDYYAVMQERRGGYPLHRILRDLLEGEKILYSEVLEGGILLSKRGGDFQLSVGTDFAIGYASHDKREIELFITESFTFRVIEPQAAVALLPE